MILLSQLAFISLAAAAAAATAATAAPAASPARAAVVIGGAERPSGVQGAIDFDKDELGAPPSSFENVIGDWSVAEADGHRGLVVDGSKWRQGEPSANLADQAKRLYGEKYAEFLDGVKAYAYFPLAVYKEPCPENDLAMSVRFYPIAGRIDQGAGLVWSVAQDGSYWGVRANALEDNLLFFKVVRGKRSVLQTVRSVETATKQWHTLAAVIHGTKISVTLDGKERLARDLESAPKGRCGLWSKADSKVLFDDFSAAKP